MNRRNELEISKRIRNLPPVHNRRMDKAYALAVKKFTHDGIRVATIGTPDIPPPQEALEIYASYAGRADSQGYQMPSFGRPELLAAASAFRNRFHEVDMGPQTLSAIKGAREGLHNIIETLTDEGDLVALPASRYPGCLNGVVRAYCKPVYYSVLPGTNLTDEITRCYDQAYHDYKRYPKVCVVVPVGNPIGIALNKESLEFAVEYLNYRRSFIVSDEAYIYNPFSGVETVSLCQIEKARSTGISIFTFSKLYDWPSARLAFAQASPEMTQALRVIDSAGQYGHHLGIQEAAKELFSPKYDRFSTEVGTKYAQRYKAVSETCRKHGINVLRADAGMFAGVELPMHWRKAGSLEAAALALENTGNRVNAGIVHGEEADCLLRVALVTDEEVLRQISEGICTVLTQAPEEFTVPSDAITSYTA